MNSPDKKEKTSFEVPLQLDSLIGQAGRADIGTEEYQGRKRNVIRYYLDPVPHLLVELLLCSWETWLSENPCPPDEPGAPCINLWIPKAASALSISQVTAELVSGTDPASNDTARERAA
jgi:hypothetical protein